MRRELTKVHLKQSKPEYKELKPLITELWKLPQREFQYFGIEAIASIESEWNENLIETAEFIITNKSWWDTVDATASHLTGPFFQKFPRQIKSITNKWNHSENIWLQRSSILFQKSYRDKTDTKLLSEHILQLKNSKEFFVQKAIGWALREYSKTNPEWVVQFIKKHPLQPLSKREGLKRMKNEK